MFIRALFTTLLVFLPAASAAHAGTRDPHTPDSRYLEFAKKFPSVMRFRSLTKVADVDAKLIELFSDDPAPDSKTSKTRPTLQYGSAVVIKPHWVLTAAHLVNNAVEHTILRDDGTEYPLPTAIIPKEYDSKNVGYYDLALCYSPKDFKLAFYTPLYTATDEKGKAATISGYGITGTFQTGGVLADGKKRAGHNKIDSGERAVLVCSPSVGRARLPLEFMIAPGDSGGGMFIGNSLAGINSFVMATDKKPDSSYGDESAFTRVSLYVNWIELQIEQYERALAARATMNSTLDFQVVPVELALEVSTDWPLK